MRTKFGRNSLKIKNFKKWGPYLLNDLNTYNFMEIIKIWKTKSNELRAMRKTLRKNQSTDNFGCQFNKNEIVKHPIIFFVIVNENF